MPLIQLGSSSLKQADFTLNTADFIGDISRFTSLGEGLSAAQIVIALGLAFVLSMAVAKVYQVTYRGVSFSPAFMHTLVISGMVIAAVMVVIGSNIARAFSLVGALSIIRYRNAVKDPRDVAFIFLAMGVGMACGTGFYQIALLLTAIVTGAILLMYYTGFGEVGLSEKIVRLQIPSVGNFEHLFDDVFRLHAKAFSLLSAETTRMGTELELTFVLRVASGFRLEKLMEDLQSLNQNLKIQVMGSSHLLDL